VVDRIHARSDGEARGRVAVAVRSSVMLQQSRCRRVSEVQRLIDERSPGSASEAS